MAEPSEQRERERPSPESARGRNGRALRAMERGTADPSEQRDWEWPSPQSPWSGNGNVRALRAPGAGTAEPSEPRQQERPGPQSARGGAAEPSEQREKQALTGGKRKVACDVSGKNVTCVVNSAKICVLNDLFALLCFASDEVIEYFFSRLKISLWGLVPGNRVHRALRETFDKFLPPNAHELVSGKLHIILTRLHDWRCVTVSEFASKEELIQAVLCSSFIPLYFGIFPPTFRGVRYVDGELAMWRADFVSRTTITISGFAGEYDICPKDGPAAFLTFQISDCILQISKMNICRLQHIFLCPTHQVMDLFYAQGYQDTVSFLKRLSK
nr:omega-hydroxyceramide transacylase-like [Taeniopygia guttata]